AGRAGDEADGRGHQVEVDQHPARERERAGEAGQVGGVVALDPGGVRGGVEEVDGLPEGREIERAAVLRRAQGAERALRVLLREPGEERLHQGPSLASSGAGGKRPEHSARITSTPSCRTPRHTMRAARRASSSSVISISAVMVSPMYTGPTNSKRISVARKPE